MGKKILISWLGTTDLKAANQIPSRPDEIIDEGPILGAIKTLTFDELHILHDQQQTKADAYARWLAGLLVIKVGILFA